MADLRLKATTVPTRHTSDAEWLEMRGLRDGSLVVCPRMQALVIEGRGFVAYAGTENAPIDIGVALDDTGAMLVVDVVLGTTAYCIFAQGVMAVRQDATLIDFMVEIDNATNRYSTAGTSFTPLNLRTDAPIASTSTVFRSADADVLTLGAKTSGGSLELYRESMEIDRDDETTKQVYMTYEPDQPVAVVGPGAIIVHFGATSGATEPTVYASVQWIEVPSSSLV